MKNAQLRRTLQKLVKNPNASQGFLQNSRILGLVGVDRQLTSRCKHQSQSQWWFFVSLAFGNGDFLSVAGVNTILLKIKNGAERFYLVAMLYLDDGIPVNSATFANEETWFKLIGAELLVMQLVNLPKLQALTVQREYLINHRCTRLYRHVSASNVKLFSSFTGSLMH